mgnify:CR=1 FL=1
MSNYRYKGTGNTGVFSWMMQRISGLLMVVAGAVLFYQILFRPERDHSVSPFLTLPFLAFGLWHTLSGFKMITDDFVSNVKLRSLLLTLYWVIGVSAFMTGIYLIKVYIEL